MKCQYRPIAEGDTGGSWRPKPCPRDGVVSYLDLWLCVEHAGKAREIRQNHGVDAARRFLGVFAYYQGEMPCPEES